MSDKELCYSADEDKGFRHDGLGDLLDELDGRGELEAGRAYYRGEKDQPKPSDLFDVDNLIEDIDARAGDLYGEYADGFVDPLRFDQAKRAELQKLIGDWLDANMTACFWRVTNVVELEVTEQDVTEFRS